MQCVLGCFGPSRRESSRGHRARARARAKAGHCSGKGRSCRSVEEMGAVGAAEVWIFGVVQDLACGQRGTLLCVEVAGDVQGRLPGVALGVLHKVQPRAYQRPRAEVAREKVRKVFLFPEEETWMCHRVERVLLSVLHLRTSPTRLTFPLSMRAIWWCRLSRFLRCSTVW